MTVRYYAGSGVAPQAEVPVQTDSVLKDALQVMRSPGGYRAGENTVRAVNVALALKIPLLVGGEPGSGKTLLGEAVAHELGKGAPLKFVVKSTSQARDLFYTFDAVRYFQAKPMGGGAADPRDFIDYQALGLAILLALPLAQRARFFSPAALDPAGDAGLNEDVQKLRAALRGEAQRQSVVIIDEVDKAPRDFPNDVLDELESMRFRVAELGGLETPTPVPDKRPLVFITTNSERQLPDAFLRRCAFLHIDYPKGEELEAIVAARLAGVYESGAPLLRDIVRFYESVRAAGALSKPPGTAELLQFLQAARVNGADPARTIAEQPDRIANGLNLLAKTRPDIAPLLDALKTWGKPA